MSLNAKCIKDIMIYLKNNLDYDQIVFLPNNNLNYSDNEVKYTCKKLLEANLIIGEENIMGYYEIEDISNKGHIFISKINNDKLWNKLLNKISNLTEPLTIAILEKLITDVQIVS